METDTPKTLTTVLGSTTPVRVAVARAEWIVHNYSTVSPEIIDDWPLDTPPYEGQQSQLRYRMRDLLVDLQLLARAWELDTQDLWATATEEAATEWSLAYDTPTPQIAVHLEFQPLRTSHI